MPTIKVNIAKKGHPIENGIDESSAGHMWITMPDGTTTGFAPGGVTANDSNTYDPGYFSQDIEITQDQLKNLEDFLKNPDAHGFGTDDYNAFTNSCVDYTWAALEAAGQNPSGFEGDLWPGNNIDNIGGLGGNAGNTTEKGDKNSDRSIPRDPLVLDLDGDGVELTNLEGSQAYFDLDGDGFATRTAWLKGDDGFLALDRNQDGKINDIGELFGSPERTGYDELGDLDSNADGIIDASDERFADLKIWQDKNGDGVSQANELRALTEAGIASIDLTHRDVQAQQGSDAQIARQGTFTWADGSQGIATDVLFSSNATFSRFVGNVAMDSDIQAVANIKGYGKIADLHIAMSRDSHFKNSVLALFESPSTTSLLTDFEQLLTDWAGVDDISIDAIDPNHRLDVDSATGKVNFRLAKESFTLEQLGIIKQYAGMDALSLRDGQWQEDGEIVTTGGYYRQAYNQLSRNLLVKFAVANGLLSDVMPGLRYDATTDLLTTRAKIDAQAFDNALTRIASSHNDSEALSSQWLAVTALTEIDPESRATLMGSINRFLSSHTDPNVLVPAFTNSVFQRLELDFTLGTSGNDTLYGEETDGVILGLGGNDTLSGRDGNDTLSGGVGNDYVYGEKGNDTLLGNVGHDYLSGGAGDDTLNGDAGRDRLYGGDGNDTLDGGTGSDTLDGGYGNDTLRGGAGSGDYLTGGRGSDTYLFGSGDGDTRIYNYDRDSDSQDVLRFLKGINPGDVQAKRSSNDLQLTIKSTGEVITVQYFFYGNNYELNTVEFADGTTWDVETIKTKVLEGTEGADSIVGYASDDTIDGLGGNDTLSGRDGNDTLSGGAGDDRVYGENGNDTVSGNIGNDYLSGGAGDDTLNGDAGRDRLYGGAGNDTLDGGTGSDTLYGEYGNDTLRGGVGGEDYLDGGRGSDTYLFGSGDGDTRIYNYDRDSDSQDVLRFLKGINPGDVQAKRSSNDLQLTIKSTGEVITVQYFFYGNNYELNTVEFADGTTWDVETIKTKVLEGTEGADSIVGYASDDTIDGLGGNDTLSGRDGNDTLSGGVGNDYVYGEKGNDTLLGNVGHDYLSGGAGDDTLNGDAGRDRLYGGDGNDTLDGGTGSDTLDGGYGNDTLRGGAGSGDYLTGGRGSDTYVFDSGFGADTIYNYDSQAGSVDIARFDQISTEDLWFSRSSNHLKITVAGTDDQVTVSNWYSSDHYRLDRIEAGASVLLDNQVDQLVSAMAAYDVPTGAGAVVPQETKDELQAVLAETWQTMSS